MTSAGNIETSSSGQTNVAGRDIMQGDSVQAEMLRILRETRDATLELSHLIKGSEHTPGILERLDFVEKQGRAHAIMLWVQTAVVFTMAVILIWLMTLLGGAL